VPRILVADDNSNIHRTVALALKEAGVEVVAVGNGEAAVRKIAEIKPDLVLADIFMPVRNGYEVCEFVKKDPRFSHIPVVLLIGAFDPFDEREAQRVQADAILKKPFLPPDSLLRTVSDLLAQSASRSAPAPAAAAPAPSNRPSPPAPASEAPPAAYMDEAPEDLVPAKARLEWNSNDQPLAFGTLLESPSADAQTDESVVTSQRDPHLGEPAFWAPKPHPEAEEGASETDDAEAKSSTGLVDAGLVEVDEHTSGAGPNELPAQTESVSRATQPESLIDLEASIVELPESTSPVKEFAATPAASLPEATLQLPELPSLERKPPENLEALPTLDSFSALSSFTVDAPQEALEVAQESVPELKDFSWAAAAEHAEREVAQPESALEVDSTALSEEALIEAATPALASLAPFLASLTSAASARSADAKEPFDFGPVPALPSEFESHSVDSDSSESMGMPATRPLDRALLEAIAQRVIERMQPQIIELVTRELLRPAVEALVQRELEKK
jgi:CheY-like chemotaxis protein